MSKTQILAGNVMIIRDDGSRDVSLYCPEESLTQQHMAAECDINNILDNWEKNGVLPTHVNQAVGEYLDIGEVGDYQTSLNIVKAAQDSFMLLPSQIRAQFDNDPGVFYNFVSDPKNADALADLGFSPHRGEGGAEPPTAKPLEEPKANDQG